MTDTPYTVEDGVYRSTYEGRAWLAASPPGGAAFGCDRTPCLVVTGDLAAARARLAPPVVSGDARTRAEHVIEGAIVLSSRQGPTALSRVIAEALCAAGLLRALGGAQLIDRRGLRRGVAGAGALRPRRLLAGHARELRIRRGAGRGDVLDAHDCSPPSWGNGAKLRGSSAPDAGQINLV